MEDPLSFLKKYLTHQSVSTDPNCTLFMQQAREQVCMLLKEMGFSIDIVHTQKHPIVLARKRGDPQWPHVLLYGHYDVQPADPLDHWQSPPFDPHIRNNRLYARGVADNKGPHTAMLYGLAYALKEHELSLSFTVILEGEEEIGSPSFPEFLKNHATDLKADCVILSDTCSPSKDQLAITTGLRGLCTLEVTLKGPEVDLHSGLYGGCVHNPIQALMELCASLHNPDGTVNIPGFYDNIETPDPLEKKAISDLKDADDVSYAKKIGVQHLLCPPGYTAQEAIRFLPTLEFNGITGGYQGSGSKTIIPSQASVKISCRLVPGQDTVDILKKIKNTLLERSPNTVSIDIQEHTAGPPYNLLHALNNQKTHPFLKKAIKACEASVIEVFNKKPLYLREGGSIPIIAQLKEILNLDSLMLGLFTPEDALHSPNESLDLDFFKKSIEVYTAFFIKLGKNL